MPRITYVGPFASEPQSEITLASGIRGKCAGGTIRPDFLTE